MSLLKDPVIYSYIIVPIYTINGYGNENYQSKAFSYSLITDTVIGVNKPFPFGMIGNNLNYNISVSFPSSHYSNFPITNLQISDRVSAIFFEVNSFDTIMEPTPRLVSIESTYLGQFKFEVGLHVISYGCGVSNIKFTSSNGIKIIKLGSEYLSSGTINDGVWSFIYEGESSGRINLPVEISTVCDKTIIIYPDTYISVSNPLMVCQLPSVELSQFNYIDDIKNISFLYNNIHIANQSVSNIMYLTLNNSEYYKDKSIALQLIDSKTLRDYNFDDSWFVLEEGIGYQYKYFAEYNKDKSRFEIRFFMPVNTMPGIINYYLSFAKDTKIYSSALPSQFTQLKVVSKNIDIYGPIFSKIQKYQSASKLGWSVTIEDAINGLKNGSVKIEGSVDNSIYILNINPTMVISGNKWVGNYELLITQNSTRCVIQDYIITTVDLEDTFGNIASFNRYPLYDTNEGQGFYKKISNPFINYLNDTNINRVSTIPICNINASIITNQTLPKLTEFSISPSSIDVGSLNGRLVSFKFDTFDESGIKENQFPIVYITSKDLRVIECISKNVSQFSTKTTFRCDINLEIGFSYPNYAIISVYGIINNIGYYSGYTSQSLLELGFPYYINTTTFSLGQPFIKSTSTISNQGGAFWIYGRSLENTVGLLIKYLDGSNIGNFTNIDLPFKVFKNAILISNFNPTNYSFIIKTQDSNIEIKIQSNEYTVNPTLFFYNYSDPIPILPTISPIPTNPPQSCQGSPICGGISQGYCSETGCICYSPWMGPTCNSKIIIIPPPTINTTNPTTDIPIPSSNNSPGENITFKSLISLISLRELDFNEDVIEIYNFEKWVYTEISETVNQYEAFIIPDSTYTSTNITVTLEFFKDQTNITFANQPLTMSPSSIKYTIDITHYPFSNQLNRLELIMSAELSSNQNDICSSKQFGNTSTGDDSNYLKIQVNDHLIYGRFIKRAIVDGSVISINNRLLDQSLNIISDDNEGKPNSIQSYIGISIPYYKSNVTIDPDFSVLISSNPVSNNDENSICSSKSGLSTPQLVGIVIGSIAFGAVIIISVSYYFYHKHQDKKYTKKIEHKLGAIKS